MHLAQNSWLVVQAKQWCRDGLVWVLGEKMELEYSIQAVQWDRDRWDEEANWVPCSVFLGRPNLEKRDMMVVQMGCCSMVVGLVVGMVAWCGCLCKQVR